MKTALSSATDALIHDRIDWNLLRTFLVIVEERSISGAAARLHLTQSAVSQALKRLETQLNHRLIERHGRAFEVTPTGEAVRQVAESMYQRLSQLRPQLTQHPDELSGSVRFLTASRIHSGVYDQFLAEFHRAFPLIELQIEPTRSSAVISALQTGTASAGLALCPHSVRNLDKRIFLRQRYAMFCGKGHRLFGRKDVRLTELQSENFVSFPSDMIGGVLSALTIFRDQHGFTGRIVATSTSLDELRRLIIAGFGVGFLPDHTVARDLADGHLWRLPPNEGVADIDLYLLRNLHQPLSRAEQAFLDAFDRYMDRFSLAERLAIN